MKTSDNNIKDIKVDNMDLIGKCFRYSNSFKRHRALATVKRSEKDYDKANYHELKMYQNFDGLELALRAIQQGLRDLDEGSEDE